jgi:serine/threonine-protein kinase
MAAHPNRQLLFGLLGLQIGLIDQSQLVAAFQVWTRDRNASLADLLCARGGLDAADRAAVEALVDRHLARHGGNVDKSLAEVQVASSARAALQDLCEPEIEASLARCAAVVDRTVTYAAVSTPGDGARFRLLRPHARGGLGAVFVALDQELHREVALKQILEQHADDPSSRTRFILEAEITGGLEHPGIVPVYSLGTYSDGRPYYVMRFIKGDSLKDAVEQFHAEVSLAHDPGRRTLELRKLLRRFVDVCNAIQYAHARGVLHRDIKPSNVIVGAHGDTLVVDWGLAKPTARSDPAAAERTLRPSSARGSSETLPGSALGTPAYMSPEQARGEIDRLGPSSDVYSLGATLYFLLTGKPPFEGSEPGSVLRAVEKGAFRVPRALDPSIDGALESVCLKAMAVQPADRYATARALADDIERWMADEPVLARREPFSRRARRWARRNRTVVAAGAAAVLVALLGTASVLAVQTRANRDLRAANKRTLETYNMARSAVDDYLTRVAENPLLKEEGLHGLRQDLLEAALHYYDEFLRQRGSDPALRKDAAAAHERVGDIRIELGHPKEALAAYDQALLVIEPLARGRTADLRAAVMQVRLEAGRLQAMKELSDPNAAIIFERVKRLGEELLASGRGTEDLPVFLARTYVARGLALRNNGRIDEALPIALRAHELCENATHNSSDDLSAARTRLNAAAAAIELLNSKGRIAEARSICEQGLAFGESRSRDHPRDVELCARLATVEQQLADIEMKNGNSARALALIRNCAGTLAALARQNPQSVRVRSQWGISLWIKSGMESDLGQYVDAEQSARLSIEANEACVRDVPSYTFYRLCLGESYGGLGKALVMRESVVDGLAACRRCVAILEPLENLNAQYNAACVLATASTVADPAEGPAASDRQRRDADHAVVILKRLIARGYANTVALKNDPDFDCLRKRPDFQALLRDLEFPARPFER